MVLVGIQRRKKREFKVPALTVAEALAADEAALVTEAGTALEAAETRVAAAVVHAPSSTQTPAEPPGVSASVQYEAVQRCPLRVRDKDPVMRQEVTERSRRTCM